MVEWSKALNYATSRKGPGFKTRNHYQVSKFLNFILRILSILTMHECFAWPEGCGGIFKKKKYLNSTLLCQLNFVKI